LKWIGNRKRKKLSEIEKGKKKGKENQLKSIGNRKMKEIGKKLKHGRRQSRESK